MRSEYVDVGGVFRERLFSPAEAALAIGCSKSFLDKRRVAGGGPPFTRIGRHVRYIEQDLQQWLEGNRRRSTSEGTVQ